AAHRYTCRCLAGQREALAFDEGRRRDDVVSCERTVTQRRPVFERTIVAVYRRVRGHSQYPLLQFELEAVHDGQHDNKYRDGETDANHRNERDERDKALASTCPQIAQSDEELVWLFHAPASNLLV